MEAISLTSRPRLGIPSWSTEAKLLVTSKLAKDTLPKSRNRSKISPPRRLSEPAGLALAGCLSSEAIELGGGRGQPRARSRLRIPSTVPSRYGFLV